MTVVLLYDGDCAFCSSSARALQRWVRPDCLVLPYQLVDLRRWGVTADEAAAEVLLVRKADGAILVRGGAAAIAGALQLGRSPWPAVGALLAAPGVAGIASLGYRVVAANRHRLPGGTPASAVDGASSVVPIG
jgi:predicted DCC family thiol-disulfide oxidoreductase YuxK